jgi:hypothetical protein
MRFVTPSTLGFGLLMFALPWLEVRCDQYVLYTQSGIQTTTGKVSLGKDFKTIAKQLEQEGNKKEAGGAKVLEGVDEAEEKLSTDPAVLVTVWAALMGLGIVLGFILPLGRARTLLLAASTAAAAGCLLQQTFVLKFPLEHKVDKQNAQEKEAAGAAKAGNINLGIPQPKVVFGIGLWLAMLATVGGIGAVAWEATHAPRRQPRQREAYGGEGDEDFPGR